MLSALLLGPPAILGELASILRSIGTVNCSVAQSVTCPIQGAGCSSYSRLASSVRSRPALGDDALNSDIARQSFVTIEGVGFRLPCTRAEISQSDILTALATARCPNCSHVTRRLLSIRSASSGEMTYSVCASESSPR
jgi:hypothetical protein